MNTRRLLCLLLAAFTATALHAQGPGSLDAGFNPNVTGGGGIVLATAVQPDGKTIVAGRLRWWAARLMRISRG